MRRDAGPNNAVKDKINYIITKSDSRLPGDTLEMYMVDFYCPMNLLTISLHFSCEINIVEKIMDIFNLKINNINIEINIIDLSVDIFNL